MKISMAKRMETSTKTPGKRGKEVENEWFRMPSELSKPPRVDFHPLALFVATHGAAPGQDEVRHLRAKRLCKDHNT